MNSYHYPRQSGVTILEKKYKKKKISNNPCYINPVSNHARQTNTLKINYQMSVRKL